MFRCICIIFRKSYTDACVLPIYKILLISVCCAFVGLDNKLYKMRGTYIKIKTSVLTVVVQYVYKPTSCTKFL